MSVLILKGEPPGYDGSVLMTGDEAFTWWGHGLFKGWVSGVGGNFATLNVMKKEILSRGLLDVQGMW